MAVWLQVRVRWRGLGLRSLYAVRPLTLRHKKRRCGRGMRRMAPYKCYMPLPYWPGIVVRSGWSESTINRAAAMTDQSSYSTVKGSSSWPIQTLVAAAAAAAPDWDRRPWLARTARTSTNWPWSLWWTATMVSTSVSAPTTPDTLTAPFTSASYHVS